MSKYGDFSGPCFPAFGLNTERYGRYGKIRTRKKSAFGHFSQCYFSGHFLTVKPLINPLVTNVPHHIETSELISNVDKLIGFYMVGNIGR